MADFKTAFLGIGTNKGIREKNIALATKLLSENKNIQVIKVSNMFKNPPQEGVKSGYFLNGVLKIRTNLSPEKLRTACKKIEKVMGREQTKSKNKKTSRIIDLDILFYENQIIHSSNLTIPHPMLHKRNFVLIPLLEIGRNIKHPILKKSIKELYNEFTKVNKKHT